MKVRCISTHPAQAQIEDYGPGSARGGGFGVVVGREYLALGLTMDLAAGSNRRRAWVEVLMEPEIPTVISAPLCLFEIVDPRASRYWEIRVSPDGVIRLWPPSFYREYYHSDLSDRDPSAVTDLWRAHALLSAEASEPAQAP